jgi:hypothetical protein
MARSPSWPSSNFWSNSSAFIERRFLLLGPASRDDPYSLPAVGQHHRPVLPLDGRTGARPSYGSGGRGEASRSGCGPVRRRCWSPAELLGEVPPDFHGDRFGLQVTWHSPVVDGRWHRRRRHGTSPGRWHARCCGYRNGQHRASTWTFMPTIWTPKCRLSIMRRAWMPGHAVRDKSMVKSDSRKIRTDLEM